LIKSAGSDKILGSNQVQTAIWDIMKIYLLRHAIAVDHETRGVTEEQRPLTQEGASKMRAAAEGMKESGVEFDALLTSPLVRARQTADIVASVYGVRNLVKEIPALKPGISIPRLWAALKPYARCGHLLLVGHEPDLSEFASVLLTGRTRGMRMEFKKGGLCLIEVESIPSKSPGLLHWHLTNKQLRAME
jgi:phosphohistidine phosphatase